MTDGPACLSSKNEVLEDWKIDAERVVLLRFTPSLADAIVVSKEKTNPRTVEKWG